MVGAVTSSGGTFSASNGATDSFVGSVVAAKRPGRENADELTNLGRQRGVLGCGERQCEGNRAAHASP